MQRRIQRSPSSGPSETSSGFVTVDSSWSSVYGPASIDKAPIAWAGVRHQIINDEKNEEAVNMGDRGAGNFIFTRNVPAKSSNPL